MDRESSHPDDGSNFAQTLQRFYDAEIRYVAAGGHAKGADFSEMAAHLHPHVVLRQGPSVPWPGEWIGADGVERFFATFAETWDTLELTEAEYFTGRDGVCIRQRMRASARATGAQVDTRVAHVITFEDGLIRDFTVYYLDPLAILDAATEGALTHHGETGRLS